VDLTPCKVEIAGVAGSLQIYGCETALFLVEDVSGQSFLLQIHNCLYGHGQFNLLSVSQFCQNPHNSVDLNLESPSLFFAHKKRTIRLPLVLEDGLFAIKGGRDSAGVSKKRLRIQLVILFFKAPITTAKSVLNPCFFKNNLKA
jgi:hypothetical protein